MVNQIKNALAMHKSVLESSWTDTCSVFENEYVFDQLSKTKQKTEVEKLSDIPCKLSYKSVSSADAGILVSTATKKAELFIGSDVEIKPGSKIVVKRENTAIEFSRTGDADILYSHRRYAVEMFKGYL